LLKTSKAARHETVDRLELIDRHLIASIPNRIRRGTHNTRRIIPDQAEATIVSRYRFAMPRLFGRAFFLGMLTFRLTPPRTIGTVNASGIGPQASAEGKIDASPPYSIRGRLERGIEIHSGGETVRNLATDLTNAI
jgi:hypothetical protein